MLLVATWLRVVEQVVDAVSDWDAVEDWDAVDD